MGFRFDVLIFCILSPVALCADEGDLFKFQKSEVPAAIVPEDLPNEEILPIEVDKEKPLSSALKIANPRSAVGEMGNMGVWEPGFHLSNTNDFIGGTDKLITQSTSFHFNTLSDAGLSWDFSYFWRLVTPIVETRFDQADLQNPIGTFVDWEQYSVSVSKYFMQAWGGFKFQMTLNYNSMRDNFGQNLLNRAHETVATRSTEYGPSYRSFQWGGGGELSYLFPPLNTIFKNEINAGIGVGWNQNDLMHELYTRANVVYGINRHLKLGIEGLYASQTYSPIYKDLIESYRIEVGGSLLLSAYWRTGLRYVSPYIKGDRYGQTYLEIIGLTVPY